MGGARNRSQGKSVTLAKRGLGGVLSTIRSEAGFLAGAGTTARLSGAPLVIQNELPYE